MVLHIYLRTQNFLIVFFVNTNEWLARVRLSSVNIFEGCRWEWAVMAMLFITDCAIRASTVQVINDCENMKFLPNHGQSITLTSDSPICRKKNHGSRKNSPNRPIICRTNFSPYVIKKSPHFKEIRPFFSSVSSQIPVASAAICQSDWLPVWNRSTIAS